MENKYLQETAMSLNPDTVEDPKTGTDTGGSGSSGDGDTKKVC